MNSVNDILKRSRRRSVDTEKFMETRQRLEWHGHKPRDGSSHQKLKEAKEPFLEAWTGVQPYPLLDFGHLVSRTTRNGWVMF